MQGLVRGFSLPDYQAPYASQQQSTVGAGEAVLMSGYVCSLIFLYTTEARAPSLRRATNGMHALKTERLRAGLLSLSTTNTRGWTILCWGLGASYALFKVKWHSWSPPTGNPSSCDNQKYLLTLSLGSRTSADKGMAGPMRR